MGIKMLLFYLLTIQSSEGCITQKDLIPRKKAGTCSNLPFLCPTGKKTFVPASKKPGRWYGYTCSPDWNTLKNPNAGHHKEHCPAPKTRSGKSFSRSKWENNIFPSKSQPCSFPGSQKDFENDFKNHAPKDAQEKCRPFIGILYKSLLVVKDLAYDHCNFQSACISHDRCFMLAGDTKFQNPSLYSKRVKAPKRTLLSCNEDFLKNMIDLSAAAIQTGDFGSFRCQDVAVIMWGLVHKDSCKERRDCDSKEELTSSATRFLRDVIGQNLRYFPGEFTLTYIQSFITGMYSDRYKCVEALQGML